MEDFKAAWQFVKGGLIAAAVVFCPFVVLHNHHHHASTEAASTGTLTLPAYEAYADPQQIACTDAKDARDVAAMNLAYVKANTPNHTSMIAVAQGQMDALAASAAATCDAEI